MSEELQPANTGQQDLENAVKQYLGLLNGDYYVECLWHGPPPVWRVSPKPVGDPPDPDMVYMQIALPVAVAEEVIRNRKVPELTDAEWEEKRAALQARVDSGDLHPKQLAHARSGGRFSVDGTNEINWTIGND